MQAEGGRSLLQEVGVGRMWGGQEIRFPGSTLLGVSAQDLLPPTHPALELPLAWDLPYPGICGILRSSPQWGGAGGGVGI